MNNQIVYEYAGFQYSITNIADRPIAIPVPGQHPAAYKEKHRRAAVECWVLGRDGITCKPIRKIRL